MKIKAKLAIAIPLAAVLIAVFTVFYLRSPVLIVTDESFLELYSGERAEREAMLTSLALFRQVKTVSVANDAGYDIVPVAILEMSPNPYCVIFPLRFARSARLFNEQNPGIPAIILEGRYQESETPTETAIGSDISSFFIYKTDINNDFYNAGLASSAIDQGKNGNVVVFIEKNLPQARENFLRGLNDYGNLLETRFFTNFSQYSEIQNLSCIVLAGSGADIIEKNRGVPVILFTWINPLLLPLETALIIDDSPWAQAHQAVKMAYSGEKSGLIKSKFHFINRKQFGAEVIALIKKSR